MLCYCCTYPLVILRTSRRELRALWYCGRWDELPRPILALHVRQGKQAGETAFFESERFLQAALEMQRRFGFKTLFVLSDSSDALMHVARHYRDRFTLAAWDYPGSAQVEPYPCPYPCARALI